MLSNLDSNLLISAGNATVNVLYCVLFALAGIAVVLLTVFMLTRYMGKAKETVITENAVVLTDEDSSTAAKKPVKINFIAILLFVLAIGLILRLIFTFLSIGYRPEYNKLTELMEYVQKNGFSGYYKESNTVFPLTFYLYSFMGMFANLFGLNAASVAMPLFVKLPMIVCDLLTAIVLYRAAKRYVNNYVAIIIAAFVCIFPLFIFASSVWGSLYSILMLFFVATLYFVARKNYAAVTGLYGAALLISKDAIFLFPLIAVFLIYNFVKAVAAVKKNKPEDIKAVIKNRECAPVIFIPVNIVATGLLMYLFSLPAFIGSYGASFFSYIYNFFLYPLVNLAQFGNNSLGIFNLFMRNGVALDTQFPNLLFVIIFGVIITAIVVLIYLSKKNRANLVFLGGYVILTLATYFVNFNEMSLLPVFGIFMLSYLLIRDKRLLKILGVLGVVTVLNAAFVMSSAGYFNNLDAFELGNLTPAGQLILTGGAGIAATVICSVVAILTHLYTTLVLLDISMSNKRKLLLEKENCPFWIAIKSWIKK